MNDLNKKLFPNSYTERNNQLIGSKDEPKITEVSVLSPAQIQKMIELSAKDSAVMQCYQSLDLATSAIANQNANVSDLYLGMLPTHAVGQIKASSSTLGTMAVLAGGYYGSYQAGATEFSAATSIGETNYTNRITEFNYTQGFTSLLITLSTISRFGANSSSNLINSYFYGGYTGKRQTPAVQAIDAGTSAIDRYNRSLKSISQIATKVQGPWCGYAGSYGSCMGNLVKAIVYGGERTTASPWTYAPVDLGNNLSQFGSSQLQRFMYNGEDMQVISATLTQPRYMCSTLQGDAKTGFTLFGCNVLNSATDNLNYSVDFDKGTQFDIDNEISTPISEFRGYGGVRLNAANVNSKQNGYLFGGVNYDINVTPMARILLKSIFEFNFATKSGVELALQYPAFPANNKGVSAQDNGYVINTLGNNASHKFNFSRKDLTPLAAMLFSQSNVGWIWFNAESDYSPSWGI